MYIIINNTTGAINTHVGNFPNLDKQLNNGEDIIIVSLYSNTVKRPTSEEYNGITDWDWIDSPLVPLSF